VAEVPFRRLEAKAGSPAPIVFEELSAFLEVPFEEGSHSGDESGFRVQRKASSIEES